MKIHELKTWPEPFQAIIAGLKKAEFRKDDRGFEVGEVLNLREYYPASQDSSSHYTGRFIRVVATDVRRSGRFGIPEGYAMISFERACDPRTRR